jgi:hypothetical protein
MFESFEILDLSQKDQRNNVAAISNNLMHRIITMERMMMIKSEKDN